MEREQRQERELTIDSLAFGGDGVAREEEGPTAGRVVFVPGTAPGDRVRVTLRTERRDMARAEVQELLSPGSSRVDPPCSLAGRCGGCAWQHVALDAQERAGIDNVTRTLHRVGGDWPEAVHVSRDPLGYRRRLRLHFVRTRIGVVLGFHAPKSTRIIDVSACPVAADPLQTALPLLRAVLDTLAPGARGSALLSADSNDAIGVSLRLQRGTAPGVAAALHETGIAGARVVWPGGDESAGIPRLSWRIGGHVVDIALDGFAQANSAIAQEIAKDLCDGLPPSAREGHVVELFSGSGTWTLPLAAHAGRITAIEGSATAAEDLRRNASELEVEVRMDDLADPSALAGIPGPVAAVVLDPPREGARSLMAPLRELSPDRILYVSCDPVTQARDLGELVPDAYRPVVLKIYAMFPHTAHVETLVVLERR